jgi:hypothetical protein
MPKSKPKTKSVTSKPRGKTAAKPKKRREKRREMSPGRAQSRKAPDREPARARAQKRSDDAEAFVPDPAGADPAGRNGRARAREDDLAELLAEDFVESATRGNEVLEDDLDRTLPDEVGGPFVVTDADEELADDVDASNPADAEVAGLPTAVAGLIQLPRDEIETGTEEEEDESAEEKEEDVDQRRLR